MAWRLHRFRHQVTLPVDEITVTNECLSEEYVEELRGKLERGEIESTDLDPIFVNIIFSEGYVALDGNHRLEAMKRAGVKAVRAELGRFIRRPPESF